LSTSANKTVENWYETVLAHDGITGNERADYEARKATFGLFHVKQVTDSTGFTCDCRKIGTTVL
jgi:ribonuclease HI